MPSAPFASSNAHAVLEPGSRVPALHADSDSLARLSVTLPRNLYRKVRLHALDQDTTLSALIAALIRKELS
jgi:hypothetical protein